jgi:hypothetical protein
MKTAITLCIGLCLLMGCSSTSTKITGTWKNPDQKQGYNRIIVTALTENLKARQTVENDLAVELGQEGVKTTKSLDILPPSFTASKEPDREAILGKIKGQKVDGILTITLVDKETDSRYVPGSFGYTPITRFGYYGRFWGYYTNWYPTMVSPGYYVDDKIYFIETNLYDADTEELIWSAQSETYNPLDLSSFSSEFASLVVDRMRTDGLFGTNVNAKNKR